MKQVFNVILESYAEIPPVTYMNLPGIDIGISALEPVV